MQQFTLRLEEKKTIADNVLGLRFAKPEQFDFKAGQFVQFLIPGSEKVIPRSYSLSSSPRENKIEFCVKLLENGIASAHFRSMQTQEEVDIKGPLGRFVTREHYEKLTFIATGVGLAPIMGIITDELEFKKTNKPVQLIFGVRSEKDIFWKDKLDGFAQKYPNFSYVMCLTQPSESWTGAQGRVTEFLKEIDPTSDYYMCGSAAMVMDARALLAEAKIPSAQIHFEVF